MARGVESFIRPHRCLLLIESVHHGNTAKVAHAIAGVLDAEIAVGPTL
jgi:flavodoxin